VVDGRKRSPDVGRFEVDRRRSKLNRRNQRNTNKGEQPAEEAKGKKKEPQYSAV
jgi:hypothetical protein